MSIPPEKLAEICSICRLWADKKVCSKKQLQYLLGSLLYVSKCVRHARFFLNRILQTLRQNSNIKIIKLDAEFMKDIAWFNKFLEHFNGVTFFDKKPIDHQVHLDACLTGVGGIWKNSVYALTLPQNLENLNIATLEMVNILVAIRMWAQQWRFKKVHFLCDNIAVVQVLQSGRTKDAHLACISRNILMAASMHDIDISVSHIPGKENSIADLLSRWTVTQDCNKKLSLLLQEPTWAQIPENPFHVDKNI